jgi:CheY-like chemotaxis protein
MTGTALILEVRGIRETLPVVLMSGYLGVAPRDARESGFADTLGVTPRMAIGVGADIVVRKPLLARELAASLARVLTAGQLLDDHRQLRR